MQEKTTDAASSTTDLTTLAGRFQHETCNFFQEQAMQRVKIQAIEQPASVTLVTWNVFEVQLPHDATPTWHLSGFRKESCRGKVSSAISSLDPKTSRCITRSGNVYELEGFPASNIDALATRGEWLQINNVQHDRDVTPEFLTCMRHED